MMMFFSIILAAGSETLSPVRCVARNFDEVRSVFPINPSFIFLHDWAVTAFGCRKIGENVDFCFEKITCRKSKQSYEGIHTFF